MVLLIIDVQKQIVNKNLYRFEDFVSNLNQLICMARKKNIEVIYIRHDDGADGILSKGKEGFEIDDRFAPIRGEKIFDKTVNSPFKETGLLEYLTAKREKQLIVAGLQTDYCIDATVKCGFEHGFEMIVPEYANSTFDNVFMSAEENYRYYNEYIWNRRYARCMPLSETLNMMKASLQKGVMHRCSWVNMDNPLYIQYHDTEWGIPEHGDKKLFEMLILECFQAGLSWECVLNKREGFRQAFDDFDVEKISRYDEEKCIQLLSDPNIIRNRLKIFACVTNSRIFMEIQKEFGSFDAYIWGFTDGEVIFESCDIRSTSPLSDQISKDLKKRGMKFVGSTVIYAYLQAIGMLNAHTKECDCYKEK